MNTIDVVNVHVNIVRYSSVNGGYIKSVGCRDTNTYVRLYVQVSVHKVSMHLKANLFISNFSINSIIPFLIPNAEKHLIGKVDD